jgi:hypothetical protein
MKTIFLILICSLIFGETYAQHSVVSTKLTTYLFVGYENQIALSFPGLKCNSISLKSSDCELKGVGCDYKVKPIKAGQTTIYVFNKLTKKIIDTIKLNARTMPQPELQIGFGEGQEKLIKSGPKAYFRCNDFDLDLSVVEFELQIWRDTTLIYEGKNIGENYTKESVDAMDSAKPGDQLVVKMAKVLASNGLKFQIFGNWKCMLN